MPFLFLMSTTILFCCRPPRSCIQGSVRFIFHYTTQGCILKSKFINSFMLHKHRTECKLQQWWKYRQHLHIKSLTSRENFPSSSTESEQVWPSISDKTVARSSLSILDLSPLLSKPVRLVRLDGQKMPWAVIIPKSAALNPKNALSCQCWWIYFCYR